MKAGGKSLVWTVLGVLGVIAAGITMAHAQQIWAGGYGRTPPRFATATTFDGSFNFCRVMFKSDRREKQGWGTDYPGADINFSVRVAELTKVQRQDDQPTAEDAEPDAVVVGSPTTALFQCPFTFMEDAGTARFTDEEVTRLRDYLLKGGFLLVSRTITAAGRGSNSTRRSARVLPPAQFPIIDLTAAGPSDVEDDVSVTKLPQMASIQTWRRSDGGVIERWNENGAPPDARGIADGHGRLMVVMVHNTDLPDPWEREGEDNDTSSASRRRRTPSASTSCCTR